MLSVSAALQKGRQETLGGDFSIQRPFVRGAVEVQQEQFGELHGWG